MNIVMSLDGVLRSDTGELIPEGLIAYRGFKVLGRVVLHTQMERTMAEAWLLMHGMAGDLDDIIDGTVSVDPSEPLQYRQLAVARTKGVVQMYVGADPQTCAEALRRGMPTMLFSSPKYARPEYRPDAPKGVRKWDDLIAERTRQQALKAADQRLQQDNLASFE